jgi:hypothetical protein
MTFANKMVELIDENQTILHDHHLMDCIEHQVAKKMNDQLVYI